MHQKWRKTNWYTGKELVCGVYEVGDLIDCGWSCVKDDVYKKTDGFTGGVNYCLRERT